MINIYLKNMLKYIAVFAGLITFYILFLMLGELIPRRLVKDNAMKSYNQLSKQGVYFSVVDGASWDNWTDSYFINSMVTEYNGNLFQKAMANAYSVYEPDEGARMDVIECIRIAVEGGGNVETYSRYWAGMKTVYKFLLIFMPLVSIRTFFFGIALLLFTFSAICVHKKLGIKGIVPYLAAVTVALYIPQAVCLVFNTDIAMMFFMMIICCTLLDKNVAAEVFYMLFFVSGSLLVYLNYWAFPLITLGFPLVLIVTARLLENYSIRNVVKETALISVNWGVGLAATVLAKQVLCKIALGVQSGTDQLLLRMGSEYSMSERTVAVINGLVKRMESFSVLAMVIVVAVWLTIMSKTGNFKKQYQCFLLVIIAFYPVIWWFALPNHCVHGFVKHMYGVTYYAMLSAVCLNCNRFRPDFGGMVDNIRKNAAINAAAFVLWLAASCVLFQTYIHYGAKESEPWSTDIVGHINIGGGYKAAVQNFRFNDFEMDNAYLKSISTILVNLPEDKKDGKLQVDIYENGNIICTSEIDISDVPVGDYFDIPIGREVFWGKEYQAVYTVHDNEKSEPYLVMLSDAQSVKENEVLYLDGVPASGTVANKYKYDDFILSEKAKINIIFVMLAAIEYLVFLYASKNES